MLIGCTFFRIPSRVPFSIYRSQSANSLDRPESPALVPNTVSVETGRRKAAVVTKLLQHARSRYASTKRTERGRAGRCRSYSVSSVPFIHSTTSSRSGEDVRIDDAGAPSERGNPSAIEQTARTRRGVEDRLRALPAAEGGAKRFHAGQLFGDDDATAVVVHAPAPGTASWPDGFERPRPAARAAHRDPRPSARRRSKRSDRTLPPVAGKRLDRRRPRSAGPVERCSAALALEHPLSDRSMPIVSRA